MIQALMDWWRGYSEEDMENVKDRLSYSKSGGIYVNRPEQLALRDWRARRQAAEQRILRPQADLIQKEVDSIARP
jgi:hypothetical protein